MAAPLIECRTELFPRVAAVARSREVLRPWKTTEVLPLGHKRSEGRRLGRYCGPACSSPGGAIARLAMAARNRLFDTGLCSRKQSLAVAWRIRSGAVSPVMRIAGISLLNSDRSRSMVAMRLLGVSDVLTNDHHFAQEGFTILFPGP